MEVSELTLLLARSGVLVLMFLLLCVLVVALIADARAAGRVVKQPAVVPPTAPAPSTAPSVHALHVESGTTPTTGSEYSLYGPLDIGRDQACDITISNRFVSGRHARIYAHQGQWVVEDLGSTNGTLLNGKPLTSFQPLAPSDRLVVGDTEFIVK